ncbi:MULTISPECIES: hypothetical protein [unclassified Bartonella]|uniref:hypothetical protein n=1 Tax=unclassified Bartonella TaxID=2645622 RepID=UPI0035CFA689
MEEEVVAEIYTNDSKHEKYQDKLEYLFDQQHKYMQEFSNTLEAKKLHDVRSDLYNYLRDIGQNGDISLLISSERSLTENDFIRYGNSKTMIKSFKNALAYIDVIENHIALVSDPVQYQFINKTHSLPKNRKGGLPYDEGRKAMVWHYKWLEDTGLYISTSIELSINEARKDNMKVIQRLYEQMQAKAIDIDFS